MIDYTEPRKIVEGYLESNITALPIVFENTEDRSRNGEHIEVFDQDVGSEKLGMSDEQYHITGIFIFVILTAAGKGTQKPREAASEIVEKLQGMGNDNMSFSNPELASVGQVEGFDLYQHNLTMSFSYIYGQDDNN